jgi:hypothetical protein
MLLFFRNSILVVCHESSRMTDIIREWKRQDILPCGYLAFVTVACRVVLFSAASLCSDFSAATVSCSTQLYYVSFVSIGMRLISFRNVPNPCSIDALDALDGWQSFHLFKDLLRNITTLGASVKCHLEKLSPFRFVRRKPIHASH